MTPVTEPNVVYPAHASNPAASSCPVVQSPVVEPNHGSGGHSGVSCRLRSAVARREQTAKSLVATKSAGHVGCSPGRRSGQTSPDKEARLG